MARLVPVDPGVLRARGLAAIDPASRGLTPDARARHGLVLARNAWTQQHVRRLAWMQGHELLGHADRYVLTGRLDGQAVNICAIGGVAAGSLSQDPDGDGPLLDAIVDEAAREGADLALLFRDPDATTPLPRGWTVVPTVDTRLTVVESTRYGAPMTLVRVGDERDLAAIAAMGQVRASACRFHLERDTGFIRHAITRKRLLAGLGATGTRQLEFVIAEEGITAAAYAVISIADGAWTIEECGDRDPSGARVGALLQALIARQPGETRPVIRAWLPPGFLPQQVKVAASTPTPPTLLLRPLSARVGGLSLSAADVLYWHNDLF